MSKKVKKRLHKEFCPIQFWDFSKSLNTIIALIIGIVVISICTTMFFFIQPFWWAYVARINNEPVTVSEFRQQLIWKRGEVISYFRTKYNAEYEAGFWNNSYGGEIPAEVVRKSALDEIKKDKIQLSLAHKEGFIDKVDYKSLVKEMMTENKKRQEAISKNQIVLGQKEYNEDTYHYYIMSDISKKLKEKLSKEWNISDEDIKNYYDSIKDTFYKEDKNGASTYVDYESIKDNLKTRYIDEQYMAHINKLAKEADVKIYESIYNKIRTDK